MVYKPVDKTKIWVFRPMKGKNKTREISLMDDISLTRLCLHMIECQ